MDDPSPFYKHVSRYEQWFADNQWVYRAELEAVRQLLPDEGPGIDIGVGTGRFAGPLGISIGVEPSEQMAEVAKERGIKVLDGVAESLPVMDSAFRFALMVTTICFVQDTSTALSEAYRILTPGGRCLVGLVDRESPLGQKYNKHKDESVFYKNAVFYSVEEVVGLMSKAGFTDFSYRQTIHTSLSEITEHEPVVPGYGEGSFVVICGIKK